jgi:ubiquinone/menaquinone biosynthesis C-methylase UbiE
LEILGSTKIAADSVDIVFVAHVFHQSGKQPEILKEAGRILKPEGKVVMVEWQKMKIPFGPPVGQRLAKDDAVRLAQSAGLQQISEFTPGHYHYGLVFGKSQADSSKSKEKK